MKKLMMLLAMVITLSACTSPNDAITALTAEGFTDIQITGYSVFGCADGDKFHTGFIAKNAKGNTVEGVVCSGWLKGATIRY